MCRDRIQAHESKLRFMEAELPSLILWDLLILLLHQIDDYRTFISPLFVKSSHSLQYP